MVEISFLGTKLKTVNRQDTARLFYDNNLRYSVSKINPEFLIRANSNEKFREIISNTLIIVDGRGVQWAARYLTLPISDNKFIRHIQAVWQMTYTGAAIIFNPKFIKYPIKEVIPGVEALELMLTEAERANIGVFFFGASEGILNKAIVNLKKQFPKLVISGTLNGYDYQKDSSINPVDIINSTDARLLIVALGSPKQEYWIHDNLAKLKNVKMAVGEGGTLDRIANPNQKAPRWINGVGLEWLWRLFFNRSQTETRSRFGRFWNSVPVFIYEVVKWKIRHGSTKITK